MDTNQYLWCFLGIAIILLIILRSYPIPICRKPQKENFESKKKDKKAGQPQQTRQPQKMVVTQNTQSFNPPPPPQLSDRPNNYPQNAPPLTYQNSYQDQNYEDNQAYNQNFIQQNDGYDQPVQPMGPPPPIETNPRKDMNSMNDMIPQGVATPEREMERFTLQNAVANHSESMGGDNFFSGGGLSPANGSEFGSPF